VLQQCATPRELFTAPVNVFVGGFIGSPAMNLLPAEVDADGAHVGTLDVDLTPAQRARLTSGAVTLGVRPESFHVATTGGLDAHVDVVEELGSESFLYCTAKGVDTPVVARQEGLSTAARGDLVSLIPAREQLHVFDTATGDRLPD
jgi:multiple sugar transport system ATP-binding protein